MPTPQGRGFPTTHWSSVRDAAQESPSGDRRAMGHLLESYLPVLRHYLVTTKRLRPETADDLLQSFVLDKVIERQLLAEADPSRGRFRAFILRVLDNHLANTMRSQSAKCRGGGVTPLEFRTELEPAVDAPPVGDSLDSSWAINVIHETLSRMERECISSARPQLWAVFHGRIVNPALNESEPVDYEALVRSGAFASPAQACNALITSKRMFERLLRSVIAQYVRDEAEIELELASLREILSSNSA